LDRKRQAERQAWQLIDGAKGSETSGARRQAIEELRDEKSDITGLDADGADLRGIDLSGADLTRASFKNAILEEANFKGANLRGVNFTGANLRGADLRGAILIDANLTGAKLEPFNKKDENGKDIPITAKLQGAKLRRAILNCATLHNTEFGYFNGENTDFSNTYLRKANISVNFEKANIEGAFFGGAKTGTDEDELDIKIICTASNWEKTYYSKSFLNKYNLSLKPDKNYDEQLQKDKDNIASLNLIELLNLLEINVKSNENKNQNYDVNNNAINVIISLKNKLMNLDALMESASEEILVAENKKTELDKKEEKYREESSLRKIAREEMERDIAQKKEE
jgi:uncharacterized protein YjbI with pentapeptide repeats